MEKCSEFDREKPSQNPFRFPPPHRRRPLMSETYRTLLHVLSHCPTGSEPQPSQQKQDEIGCNESGKDATTHGGLVDQYMKAEIELSVNDIDCEKSNSHVIWEGGGNMSDAQIKDCIDLLDHINDVMEVNGEVPQENGDNSGISSSLVDSNQASTVVSQLNNEQVDESNIPELQVGESDLVGQKKMDKEISIHEAFANIESCFLTDEGNELMQLVQCGEEKSHVAENNLLEDLEHGLQLKEMELQNLISAFGTDDSQVCETAVEEIEEGEISGDAGASDESDSYMLADTVSLEQRHPHVSITAQKESIHDAPDAKLQEKFVLASFSNDSADGCSNVSKEVLGKNTTEVQENDFEMFVCQKDVETKNIDASDSVINSEIVTEQIDGVSKVDSFGYWLPLKTISVENVTENHGSVADTEDANETKKKKRGPMTKEKRAKKKAKERIKRAEKNRKLGVKRLKLPPVVMKPKQVSYCRHYLNGRCQEGEKCKFSHDRIPLTKSKPCCHFARHSCMKGDDCPFDHQLSKYPCNNFVSNGYCGRGADCLFSHKVPSKTESLTTSTIPEAELKSPLLSSSLSPKMQVNAHGSPQPFPGKRIGQTVSDPVLKLPVQAPKGVSFLTCRKLPVNDAKNKEAGSSLKEGGDSGKFSKDEIHSKSDNTQKPNDVNKPTSRIPQGINFLSFGKAPLTDSSFKAIPNLLSRDYGFGKLQLSEINKGKDTASTPTTAETRALPKSTPRGISLLSFGKASLDATSSSEQAIFGNKKCNIASPVVPSNQLLGQSALKHSVGMPNSSKTTFLENMPSSAQKTLESTLAFAAKFDSGIKLDRSIGVSVSRSNIKEHH